MVKKIRRKLKVVKKVRKVVEPDQEADKEEEEDGEDASDVEEMEDISDDKTDDDEFGFAKTVTASDDTADKIKDKLIAEVGTDDEEMEEDEDRVPEPGPPKVEEDTGEGEEEEGDGLVVEEMEPLDEAEEGGEDEDDEEFDKHREAIEASFDLQEKVMREIEDELFKKEAEVREKVESIAKENPLEFVEILENVKDMDTDTIKDFVVAAETLYKDRMEELPGDKVFWSDLKRKAGLPDAAPRTVEEKPVTKASKAEEYRRREKAIDIFRNSLFGSAKGGETGFGKSFASPLRSRATQGEGQHSSHFFGPAIEAPTRDKDKKESISDFLRLGKADVSKTEDMDKSTMQKVIAELKLKLEEANKALTASKTELMDIKGTGMMDLEGRVDDLNKMVKAKDIEIKDLQNRLEEAEKARAAAAAGAFSDEAAVAQEIKRLNRALETVNFDLRTKNDTILHYEEEIRTHKDEIARQKDMAKQADAALDDTTKLQRLEELALKEEEIKRLEDRAHKNLGELKDIARENMKSEYRLKRKEMVLENMERDLDSKKKEIEKRSTEMERARHEMAVKEEMLEERHKELLKKEEDFKLAVDKLEHEKAVIDEKDRKIKANLREQSRMDYRIDKRQQELRIQEAKIREVQEALARKMEELKAKEEELAVGGGSIDTSRLNEVLKMKSLELAKKEETLKSEEEDIQKRRKAYEAKMNLLEEEGKALLDGDTEALWEKINKREKELDKKEEELREMEISVKEQQAKVQREAALAAAGGGTPLDGDLRPLLKVRCVGCRDLIPIYSTARPLKVTCPKCGKVGILK